MFSDWKAVERCALVPLSHLFWRLGPFSPSLSLFFTHIHTITMSVVLHTHRRTHTRTHACARARVLFFFGALLIVFYFLLSSSIL